MSSPKVRTEPSVIRGTVGRQQLTTENPVGQRIIRALGARSIAWLAAEAKQPENTIRDAIRRGIAKADLAVAIADALGRSVDWLLTGADRSAGALVSAADADYTSLPLYNLDNITDDTKGPTIERVPFRRDWLYRFAGPGQVLWLTHAPSGFRAADISRGAVIICSDIPRDRVPYHAQVCIFAGSGRPFIAKYSEVNRAGGSDVVTRSDLAEGDLNAIAHVRASLINEIDLTMQPER